MDLREFIEDDIEFLRGEISSHRESIRGYERKLEIKEVELRNLEFITIMEFRIKECRFELGGLEGNNIGGYDIEVRKEYIRSELIYLESELKRARNFGKAY